MKKIFSSYLKRIASPGFISEGFAITASYLAILILFPFDINTSSQVSLHVLYVFPLTLIALHCSRSNLVIGAAALSITLQAIALWMPSEVSFTIKIYLFLMIVLSNSTFVLVARFARTNIIEAERLSTIDPLTKLSNRRALEIAIDAEIVRQRRYGGYFSVVLIDLDGFKGLNDSLGHHAGDRALIMLADILRDHTRQSDTISRIGGDEFVILMPNTQAADCEALCQTLCHKITHSMAEVSFLITASIGYTTIEQAPEISKDVIAIADRAMYTAKSSGKGRVVRGYSSSF
ncbi:GGDEF domain-containing protein [Solimicrobium silvestre]|uniref:diguanylate cyclase n=1 Tax=Solimicrobium silvestre TaxID=2099400 RepID=A0A2S9GVP7_9BURK|nr:GGDEF domain-containing protein [Solimicrobium silvestre]PRC91780.1 GGDEF: diguanylate cyclase (GGDEF) domain [Solimicrobium silvestre]